MKEKSVRTIPKTKSSFTSESERSKPLRRVAAYARVSTDLPEQLTSYEAQIRYYTDYIKNHDGWEFAGMYTDEGITGTSTKHREGFKQMIADALDGKIDLIITKSISRFARNTVDSLTAIRNLKAQGIECYFEKENINTFDGRGELLLTIMSSLAQEEARSVSENCTWGLRRRFAEGKVSVPFKNFLGYDRDADGNLAVNKSQAKLVRRIYGMYLSGIGAGAIANTFSQENIPAPSGGSKWYASTVKSILTNEKYKGDALLQKTYTEDFLTKSKKINNGEVQQYYVKNNHEPIIEPRIFDMVQEIMRKGNRRISAHVFSGKVICGRCKSVYGSRVWHSSDKYRRRVWQCCRSLSGEAKCAAPHLYDEQIENAFLSALNKLLSAKNNIRGDFELINKKFPHTGKAVERLYTEDIAVTEFDSDLWLSLVDFMTVNSREDIRVTFRNGRSVRA